jgi:hypothetical protein
VTNGEDMDDHKLQYFPNSLRGKSIDWFVRYKTICLAATWNEVQHAFINRFSEICNKGQVAATLKYAK